MAKEVVTLIVCITIVISTAIVGVFSYNVNDRNNMSKNIETAINKGLDPISVKCAYETVTNTVCALYASGKK